MFSRFSNSESGDYEEKYFVILICSHYLILALQTPFEES